jgi:hypothetical protein
MNVTSTANAQSCSTDYGACNQAYDIAYEQLSGDFLFVFGNTTTDGVINYKTWDGVASTTNSFTFNGGSTVDTLWVRLVPDGIQLPSRRSDRILMLIMDANNDIFGSVWDGTQFTASTTITTEAYATTTKPFDGAWETSSGTAVVVYSSGTVASTQPFSYKSFNGSSWDATATLFPAITACGTSPAITGTNTAGFVTVGSGVISSCTLTFSTSTRIFSYRSKPACVVSNESQNAIAGVPTSSTLVISGVGIQDQILHYACFGIRE